MEIKNSKIAQKVEELMDESDELYDQKHYQKSISKLLEAWDVLPVPKEKYDESFHIAEGLAETFFLIKNNEEAVRWAKKLGECDPERQDDGDSEFLLGKIYYEMNDMETAKAQFLIAMKKSEGRLFDDAPKKYSDLLKKK
jgi:tetratricopeptide (TPR) repeat protein